jgi:hypothetical protein
MDATTTFVAALLARLAGRAGRRHPAVPGSLVLAVIVALVVAVAVGVLVAELVMPDPEVLLAAPFRWRER